LSGITSCGLPHISPLLASRLRYLRVACYGGVESLGRFLPHCVALERLNFSSDKSIAPALNALTQPLHTVRELKLGVLGRFIVCVDTARAIIRAFPALSTLLLYHYEFTDEARVQWSGSALSGVKITYVSEHY